MVVNDSPPPPPPQKKKKKWGGGKGVELIDKTTMHYQQSRNSDV